MCLCQGIYFFLFLYNLIHITDRKNVIQSINLSKIFVFANVWGIKKNFEVKTVQIITMTDLTRGVDGCVVEKVHLPLSIVCQFWWYALEPRSFPVFFNRQLDWWAILLCFLQNKGVLTKYYKLVFFITSFSFYVVALLSMF